MIGWIVESRKMITYSRDQPLELLKSIILILGNGDLEALGLEASLGLSNTLSANGLGVSTVSQVSDLSVDLDQSLKVGVGKSVLGTGHCDILAMWVGGSVSGECVCG